MMQALLFKGSSALSVRTVQRFAFARRRLPPYGMAKSVDVMNELLRQNADSPMLQGALYASRASLEPQTSRRILSQQIALKCLINCARLAGLEATRAGMR